MNQWIEQTVQGFFAQLNWDNRPPLTAQAHQAMPFMTVAGFLESIPWTGDPGQLSAQSLHQATTATGYVLEEDEDLNLTLSDLSSLF